MLYVNLTHCALCQPKQHCTVQARKDGPDTLCDVSLQDGTYTAAMLDLSCSSDLVFFPANTNEVAAHISKQVQAATAGSTGLKIRATRRQVASCYALTSSKIEEVGP